MRKHAGGVRNIDERVDAVPLQNRQCEFGLTDVDVTADNDGFVFFLRIHCRSALKLVTTTAGCAGDSLPRTFAVVRAALRNRLSVQRRRLSGAFPQLWQPL